MKPTFPLKFVIVALYLFSPNFLLAQSPLPDEFDPGVTDAGFNDPTVFALSVQADGKVLLGGFFTTLGGQPREFFGRVHADGTLDPAFNPGVDGPVYALAGQTDGKILAGGIFSTLGGQQRDSIGRLNAGGTLDATFNVGANGPVYALAVQADGKILVGGEFTTLGGLTRNRIGRLNTNGTPDTTFNPGTGGSDLPFVGCLAVQADGKIVVGGWFTTLGGQPRSNIGRLNANGTLDTAFNPGASGGDFPFVATVALQADGKVVAGGGFTTLGGQPRDYLGRLNTNGTVDATFNPGADERVVALGVQTDGKILAGGAFTTLGGQARNYIGRINADGTLDNVFHPGADNLVDSLAVQRDGKILVGGAFISLGGQPRSSLGRLNNTDPATESLSHAGSTITWQRGGTGPEVWRTTFEHSANGLNWTNLGAGTRIAGGWQRSGITLPAGATLRARGHVVGGGQNNGWFVETFHGLPVILLQPNSRTNNFGSSASFYVEAGGNEPFSYQWLKNGLPLADQGNITGSTSDTLVVSQSSNSDEGGYVAVLTSASGSVTSLVATLTVVDPHITQHPAGATRSAGGSVTFNVAAIGTPPLSYQWYHDGTAVTGAVGSSLSLSNLSAVNVGPYSVVVGNSGGSATSAPALLTVNSATIDNTFNPGANAAVFSLAVQPDGKILVGGAFTTLGGAARNRIARLNSDGTLDIAFDPGVSGGGFFGTTVNALLVQADGRILVGGDFTTLGGLTRYRIGRLNSTGTVDTNFNPVIASFVDFDTSVECLALQADGKILVGGIFTSLGGAERVNIGRLNTTGTADSFNPGLPYHDNSQPVYCLAVQADGKILVGGYFTELGRQSRTNFGRVTATGSLDTTFNPGVDGTVQALAVQADGKILVGGDFSSLGGQTRNYVGRLNTNGTIDAAFNPGASAEVISIAVQADGKILLGGSFTTLGGQTRNRIARLNADGTLDGAFNPGAGGVVRALTVQADGRILAGGNFGTLSGQSRSAIGRLNNTGTATQRLNYASSTVTWLRGGAGPEVWRTTFDHSADGLTWTSLGAGTRISGGWQRTGVSLPAGRALRAQGHVVGSDQNSGYFVESYFGKPVIISQPPSRTNGAATTATFIAVVEGSEPLNYQWLKNGLPLENQGNIAGANGTTLTLSQVLRNDEGAFRLVVSNSFGSATSIVATLTVPNPLITQHPADAHRNAGENVTFNVTAVGIPAPSFQWYHDGAAVPGAVGSSLTLQNLSRADAGLYTVVVSNTDGSVTNMPALLSVNSATVDSAFNPGAGGGYLGKVHALAVQADGRILVGGDFTSLDGEPRENLGRLNAEGALDITFNPEASGGDSFTSAAVYSMAVQTDGKILVGGSFDTLSDELRNNIGRLHANGTVDSTFNPGVIGGDSFFGTYVYCMALQADGKILLGGDFTTVAGQTRNRLARLNANGTLDSSFTAGANEPVKAIAIQADGKILVGGAFTSLGGSGRNRIARLNENGTLDTTFNPGVSGGDETEVHALSVQSDGKILVGGDFTILRGQSRTNLGRLNADGTLDTSFNPVASAGVFVAYVYSFALQADGKIVVGGDFTTLGGQARADMARLNADGTLDITFSPKSGNGEVLALAVQPDGEILVGGYFDTFVGQHRSRIARLNSTDPATQTLGFAGSTVTWLRGGTSPEVWRTSFEHSVNGLSWADLGAGTRIPGGWHKTAVTLPQAGTLRARGFIAGADESSGWFAETILDLTPTIQLSLAREGPMLVLNWTGGQGPYQVQQSANFSNPNSWQNLGAPVTTNSLTLPIGTGNQFLRVRSQ